GRRRRRLRGWWRRLHGWWRRLGRRGHGGRRGGGGLLDEEQILFRRGEGGRRLGQDRRRGRRGGRLRGGRRHDYRRFLHEEHVVARRFRRWRRGQGLRGQGLIRKDDGIHLGLGRRFIGNHDRGRGGA